MHLKENFAGTIQEKNAFADENRKLKEILRMHGITDPSLDGNSNSGGAPSTYAGSVADSRAGSYAYNPGFSPPPSVISGGGSPSMAHPPRGGQLMGGPQGGQQRQQGGLDHDQVGVDFVLASVNRQDNSRYLAPSSQKPYSRS